MKNQIFIFLSLYGLLSLSLSASPSLQTKKYGRIPDEYEASGGHSLGFSHGGMAASSDTGSIRNNPAMLAVEKKYQMTAAYHWPTFGREYYELGVIDSKTSPVAAGMSLVSSRDEFLDWETQKNTEQKKNAYYDSSTKRRISAAFAQIFSNVAVGIGAQYLETSPIKDNSKITAVTMNMGLASLLTPQLRVALSIENLNNNKIKDFAPKSYRAAFAYTMWQGRVTLHGDYKQRERVAKEKDIFDENTDEPIISDSLNTSEKMLVGSFSIQVQDLLRIIGGYGQAFDNSKRKTLSGGLALINKNVALSYSIYRPYLSEDKYHQGVNLAYNIQL